MPKGVRSIPIEHDAAPSRRSAYSEDHWWSVGVLQTLRRAYRDGGPDVLELTDRGGPAAVPLQAKLTLDPFLRDTVFCVRLDGTREMRDVLDGAVREGFEAEVDHDLERYALRHADRLIAGPAVMHAYRSFYAGEPLASDLAIPPTRAPLSAAPDPPFEGPLRMLCVGPFARRTGIPGLVSAVLGLERDDWRLTICGEDTRTGPLGQSMRDVIDMEIAGDPRVVLSGPASREKLLAVAADHHLILMPSICEPDPADVLDVLACNRPVLAPPSGVFPEVIEETSGWLRPPNDDLCLREAISELLDDPDQVMSLIARRGPRTRSLSFAEPVERVASYRSLIGRRREPRRGRRDRTPLVSVVVPYHRMSSHVEETIDSVLASTYAPLEVTIVNDGSFEPEDGVLMELDRRPELTVIHQVNAGPSAARNTGFRLARGEYILPLDADDMLGPSFIARCVEVLETHPEYAFVTCWARHVDSEGQPTDDGYLFLGNEPRVVLERNVAGTPSALLRATHVDRGNGYTADVVTHEDWSLYRTMHQRGLYGHVIPGFLFRYRVRTGSMSQSILWPHTAQLVREVRARGRQSEVSWTPTNS